MCAFTMRITHSYFQTNYKEYWIMTDNTLSDLIFEADDDLIDALEEMIYKLEEVIKSDESNS